MENEQLPATSGFEVSYQPSTITITNYEQLKAAVAQQADKYKGLIVTESTLQSAKSARAELNKFSKAIDDRRKEIKREYNQPLKAFEAEIKALTALVSDSIEPIDEGIKDLEQRQQADREKAVLAEIAEIAVSRDIDPELIEAKPSWLTKSISGIQRTREIGDAADYIAKEIARKKADKEVVKRFAEANGFDAGGWVDQIERGVSQLEVLDAITRRKEQLRAQEEREKRQAEAQAAIEASKREQVGDKVVNTETGEIVPQTANYTIKLASLTQEQITSVEEWLTSQDIEFAAFKDMEG